MKEKYKMNKNSGIMFSVDKEKIADFLNIQKNEKLRDRADVIVSKIENIITNTDIGRKNDEPHK